MPRMESKYEWRDWLYEEEFNRIAEVDQTLERLQVERKALLDERRGTMQRAVQRYKRDMEREIK